MIDNAGFRDRTGMILLKETAEKGESEIEGV